MNLKNLYDKQWLGEVVENRNELLKEIRQSKGFILTRLKEENLMPKLEWLWQDISSYSLMFIIDNYNLPDEAKRELNEYLDESSQFKIKEEEVQVATNMQEALEKNIAYPTGSKLTLDLFLKYRRPVEALMLNDKNIQAQVNSLLNTLTLEDLSKIDEDFFRRNFSYFKEIRHLMHSVQAKELYKNIANQIQMHVNDTNDFSRKKQGAAINQFDNYIFNKDEKEFLFEVIRNEEQWRRNFSTVERIAGAKELITKEEFFTHFKTDDLSLFSLKETDEFQDLISKTWLKEYLVNEVIALDDLLSKKTTLEQFKTIVTENFIQQLYDANRSFHINEDEQEISERKEKDLIIKKALFNILIKNPDTFKSNVDIIDFINIFEQCDKNNLLNADEKFQAKEIMNEKFHQSLKSEEFFSLYSKNNVYQQSLYDCFINEAENYPSANLLIMMMKTSSQSAYTGKFTFIQKRQMREVIHQVISKMNDEEVLAISDWMDYSIDIKALVKDNPKSVNFSENIMNLNGYHPHKTEEMMNIFLITEFEEAAQKFNQEKGTLSAWAINRILNRKDKNRIDFIHDYIAIHPEALEDKELIKAFRKNKDMIQYVQQSAEEKEKTWAEFFNLVKQCVLLQEKEIEQQKNNLKPVKKFNSDTPEIEVLKKTISHYVEEIDIHIFEEKFAHLLKEKQFNFARFIQHSCGFNKSDLLIKEYLKSLDYENWSNNLENPAFIKLAETVLTQDKTNVDTIDIKDEHQAYNLAVLLLKKVSGSSYRLLTSFTQESRDPFIHELIIKHLTKEMFYDFQFQVNSKPDKGDLLTKPFSNEQILQAYLKMEKEDSVFKDKDYRANEIMLFAHNFENNELAYHKMIKIAENYPKLYVLLTKGEIYRDMVDTTEMDNEQAQNAYLVKHFNLDILIEGFKEILEDFHNQDRTQINSEVLKKAASTFLSGTYYHVYDKDKGNDPDYASFYNEEQSRQLITMLLENNPLLLQYYSHIGSLNCSEDVARHYDYYHDIHVMEQLMLVPHYMMMSHFEYQGRFKNYTETLFNGLVDYYIDEEKIEEIHYLLHLANQSLQANKLSAYLSRTEPITGPNMEYFTNNGNWVKKLEKFLVAHNLEKKLDSLYQDDDVLDEPESAPKLKI